MQEHKPYIADSKIIPELTPFPLLIGCLLGIVFGASSLYLTLKVGMTVSASIPVAVLSITFFRLLSNMTPIRNTTILENNIVQTAGSAGESIAFGVAATMPAILILGHDMELWRVTTVSVLGGLLGVLMMIPLRKALVVEGGPSMVFPEGTACAEVLIVGEKGGLSAKTVVMGFVVGLAYKTLNLATKLWAEVPNRMLTFFKGASVSCEVSPELLGVGYILGPRNASIMFAGGVMAAWLLTPAIKLFGGGLLTPLFPATKLISEMSPSEIRNFYVLYIGAGAVATAGIISLFQNLPTIIRSAKSGLGSLRKSGVSKSIHRTDTDVSFKYVIAGCLLLIAAISAVPSLHMNLLGSILIIIFGFLFVTVSSRLTGEVGSSSNPVSGMTVATLLLTSLIFLFLGWTAPEDRITALSVAAIVCVAAANGGTTAQDLKTGQMVGATPKKQQIAILFGALTSAVVIGVTLNFLNDVYTVYSKKNVPEGVVVSNVSELTKKEHIRGADAGEDNNEYRVLQLTEKADSGPLQALSPGKYLVDDAGVVTYLVDPGINGVLHERDDGTPVNRYDAPKARLMSLIIDGILTQKLPWGLILLGSAIAIFMELCGVSSLAFATGVYLPFSSTCPIFLGGAVRWLVQKLTKKKNDSSDDNAPGILYASGLIAGGSIAGILIALSAVYKTFGEKINLGKHFPEVAESNWLAVTIFAILMISLFKTGIGGKKAKAAK